MESSVLDNTQQLRSRILMGICALLGLLGLLLGLANLFLVSVIPAKPILAFFQFLFAALSIYLLWLSANNKQRPWHAKLYIYTLTALVIYAIYQAQLSSFLFSWALTLPIVYFLMLGKESAQFPTVVLLCTVLNDIFLKTAVLISPPIVNFLCAYLIVWIVSYLYENSREHSEYHLQQLALRDPLTQSFNRLALSRDYNSISDQTDLSVYVLVLDIDFFKQVNDRYGHEAGDTVLKHCAQTLEQLSNPAISYRIGGEEFCILLTAPAMSDVIKLAEKIKLKIPQQQVDIGEQKISITVSIGIAKQQTKSGLARLLATADQQLYKAKKAGRNTIMYSEDLVA